MRSLVILGIAVLVAVADAAASTSTYSYEAGLKNGQERSPSSWGAITSTTGGSTLLFPLCKSGTQQSPIDVPSLSDFPPSSTLYPLELGKGNVWIKSASITNDGAQMTISGFLAAESPIILHPLTQKGTFKLDRIMIHAVSEHTFGGSRRDMEIHLVFKSTGASTSTTTSTAATATESTVIVAITAVAGSFSDNEVLRPLWAALPIASANSTTDTVSTSLALTGFDYTMLLPPSRDYATYPGSLTYPPCTEGVRYVVMLEPIHVSTAQYERFRTQMRFDEGKAPSTYIKLGNYRPVQSKANTGQLAFYTEVLYTRSPVVLSSTTKENQDQVRDIAISAICIGAASVALGIYAIVRMMIVIARGNTLEEEEQPILKPATPQPQIEYTRVQQIPTQSQGALTPAATPGRGAKAPDATPPSTSPRKDKGASSPAPQQNGSAPKEKELNGKAPKDSVANGGVRPSSAQSAKTPVPSNSKQATPSAKQPNGTPAKAQTPASGAIRSVLKEKPAEGPAGAKKPPLAAAAKSSEKGAAKVPQPKPSAATKGNPSPASKYRV